MRIYSFDEFKTDVRLLAKNINDSNIKPDCIVAVARGGMAVALYLSHLLEIRPCFCVNCASYDDKIKRENIEISQLPKLSPFKCVLIAEDIIDSGRTLQTLLNTFKKHFKNCEFFSASIFYKNSALISPNFYSQKANEWIKFPWEENLKEIL